MTDRHSHGACAVAIRTLVDRDAARKIGARPSEAEMLNECASQGAATLQALADHPDIAMILRDMLAAKRAGVAHA